MCLRLSTAVVHEFSPLNSSPLSSDGTLKLADFGLAKVLPKGTDNTSGGAGTVVRGRRTARLGRAEQSRLESTSRMLVT